MFKRSTCKRDKHYILDVCYLFQAAFEYLHVVYCEYIEYKLTLILCSGENYDFYYEQPRSCDCG